MEFFDTSTSWASSGVMLRYITFKRLHESSEQGVTWISQHKRNVRVWLTAYDPIK